MQFAAALPAFITAFSPPFAETSWLRQC